MLFDAHSLGLAICVFNNALFHSSLFYNPSFPFPPLFVFLCDPQGGAHGWSVSLLPLLMSGPLWAIILSQMCANWSYYTLLTSLPTYMDTVLHFDLRQVTYAQETRDGEREGERLRVSHNFFFFH